MYTYEAIEKWGCSMHFINECLRNGRIQGAFKRHDPKFGNRPVWIIPDDCPKPAHRKRGGARIYKPPRTIQGMDIRDAPIEVKREYIFKNSASVTYGQLKEITGLSHMEIRNIYDSFFR